MGWSAASEYVDSIWERVKSYIPEAEQPAVAVSICKVFQRGDWDTESESEAYQVALNDDDFFVEEVGRHCDSIGQFAEQIIDYKSCGYEVSDDRVVRLLNIYTQRKANGLL